MLSIFWLYVSIYLNFILSHLQLISIRMILWQYYSIYLGLLGHMSGVEIHQEESPWTLLCTNFSSTTKYCLGLNSRMENGFHGWCMLRGHWRETPPRLMVGFGPHLCFPGNTSKHHNWFSFDCNKPHRKEEISGLWWSSLRGNSFFQAKREESELYLWLWVEIRHSHLFQRLENY